ncbi:tetratricopeptide repeat protein [Streptomyces sp. NPDC052071]|uniref:tetratricopeptide repeat protein n=1 Tax=Streptomyces TaxID=1883 RepID=UPI0025B2DB9D|nr:MULTISPECIES: tetratricopeptide repeat protein [Streptomyces]WJY35473.1 tetratricopeptide repeat protein [Streptomyces sp. P9-2B-1]
MTPRWPRRRKGDDEAVPAAFDDTVPAPRHGSAESQQVTVGDGGVGAGRDVSHNAFGQGSQVVDNRQTHIHHTPREVTWPLEVGTVPGLASAFQPRSALRDQVDAARAQGSAAVLTQVLSGGGGVGKSQLAAAYAGEALRDGTDLVLWASAVEVQQVVTLYAQAAVLVAAPGTTGADPERDARALLSWLATTNRRWLVVLDDITDPTAIRGWWPASRTGSGWVLATTRLHDASLTGSGRRRVRVDVYTPVEAASYLRTRLTDDEAGHLLDDTVDELAAALGHLPLALGHAAAYMLNQDLTCAQYVARFKDNDRRLEHVLPEAADADGYGRQIATTLLLSLDAAQRTEPVGLARPALQLAAHLDPAGHPHALWNTPAVLAYLTEHRTPAPNPPDDVPEPVNAEETETVLRILHRYALITSDRRQEPRAVRIHALTARATRETTPKGTLPALTWAAANALLNIWPNPDHLHPELAAALRTSTDHLHQHTGDHLWQRGGHEVLYSAGASLVSAGLTAAAIAHWKRLVVTGQRILGAEHPDHVGARSNLAASYWEAGRIREAITLQEAVLADSKRILGPQHHVTLKARNNLATSYWQVGRIDEAIVHKEAVLADSERVLGPQHADTLRIRGNLADAYQQDWRTNEAITLQEAILADSERILGPQHPDTLSARSRLAVSYRQAGLVKEAITLQEAVLADSQRILGPQHPKTLGVRNNLAASYHQAGRTDEAITLQEAALADSERLNGPQHPTTISVRNNLATSYSQAGRTDDALLLAGAVLADCERVFAPQHPRTLDARGNLAALYWEAGRTSEAITLQEAVLADSERVFGPQHPSTFSARSNLAASYLEAGRTSEAITLQEAVLADSEREFGPQHPTTLTVRNNLAAVYARVGRTSEALALGEAVLADSERLLGPHHPNTASYRGNLAAYRQVGP